MNKYDLIIFQPPSDKSKEFEDYCSKNQYSQNDPSIYIKFLQDVLSTLFIQSQNDGLCCLIFPKFLTRHSEIVYANIISMGTLGHMWGLNDEIILTNEKDTILGKIAILKKDDKKETISRAERLTYISIPSDEKDSIVDSVWVIDTGGKNMIEEKVIRWLILSYSNSKIVLSYMAFYQNFV